MPAAMHKDHMPGLLLLHCRFQVLFTQLGLAKLVEYIQLGLLPRNRVITMKVSLKLGRMGTRRSDLSAVIVTLLPQLGQSHRHRSLLTACACSLTALS